MKNIENRRVYHIPRTSKVIVRMTNVFTILNEQMRAKLNSLDLMCDDVNRIIAGYTEPTCPTRGYRYRLRFVYNINDPYHIELVPRFSVEMEHWRIDIYTNYILRSSCMIEIGQLYDFDHIYHRISQVIITTIPGHLYLWLISGALRSGIESLVGDICWGYQRMKGLDVVNQIIVHIFR